MESGTGNILIVDDNRLIRRIMRDVVELEGYRCFEAESVNEALSVVKKQKLDVCFLDLHLSDGTGIDFLRLLNATGTPRPARIFLVTGSDESGLSRRATDFGADGVLYKPVDPQTLLSKIREV